MNKKDSSFEEDSKEEGTVKKEGEKDDGETTDTSIEDRYEQKKVSFYVIIGKYVRKAPRKGRVMAKREKR